MRVAFDDGALALLVIEWKYAESYGGKSVETSSRGTDRVATNQAPIEADDAHSTKKTKPQEPLSRPATNRRDQSIGLQADPNDPKEVTDTKAEL